MQSKIERMRGLIATIKQADTAYFRDDRPIMSDRDYDVAVDLLKDLEHDTGVILSDSPTQTVPGEILESLTEVRHARPMLAKTRFIYDLVRFAGGRDLVLSKLYSNLLSIKSASLSINSDRIFWCSLPISRKIF